MHQPLQMIAGARPNVMQVARVMRATRQHAERRATVEPLWDGRTGERFALALGGFGAQPANR